MKYQKVLNVLNEPNDFKFMPRKCNIANDDSKVSYNAANEIPYNIKVLKRNICDYRDAYILVTDDITVVGHNIATEVAFKNCAPLTKCITKIDETTIDDADDLDLVMSMYNLIERHLF